MFKKKKNKVEEKEKEYDEKIKIILSRYQRHRLFEFVLQHGNKRFLVSWDKSGTIETFYAMNTIN